jgi:hypothetical protein
MRLSSGLGSRPEDLSGWGVVGTEVDPPTFADRTVGPGNLELLGLIRRDQPQRGRSGLAGAILGITLPGHHGPAHVRRSDTTDRQRDGTRPGVKVPLRRSWQRLTVFPMSCRPLNPYNVQLPPPTLVTISSPPRWPAPSSMRTAARNTPVVHRAMPGHLPPRALTPRSHYNHTETSDLASGRLELRYHATEQAHPIHSKRRPRRPR